MSRRRLRLRATAARLPLRVRLVAGFVAAMVVVLSGAGAFVYWRVRVALDTGLHRTLTEQMSELRGLVDANGNLRDDPAVATSTAASSSLLLSTQGSVLAAGPVIGSRQLLSGDDLEAATRGTVVRNVGRLIPASRSPIRLLASRQGANVLVVTVARDQRDEALRELLGQLALAGLGALLVAAVVGERLAKAALEPVERYRSQAETIVGGVTGVRLDVPAGRDDEVTRLGHTFNHVLGALERALDTERAFTQAASHELRTPLTTLSGRVQLTRQRRRSAAEYERALDEMSTDIHDLATVAEQLLALGAADRDGTPGDSQTLTDIAEIARAVASGRENLTVHAPTSPVFVQASSGDLRQILGNLIRNAEVHGNPPVDLQVRVVRDGVGNMAVVVVHDQGDPIDPAFLTMACDRFQRSDDARGRPGSGLGLALVAALVDRHRGELRLCSAGYHHRQTKGGRQSFTSLCGWHSSGTCRQLPLPGSATTPAARPVTGTDTRRCGPRKPRGRHGRKTRSTCTDRS